MSKQSFIEETNDFIVCKDNHSNYSDLNPSRNNGYQVFPNESIRDIMSYLGKDAYECWRADNQIVIGHHDGTDYYEIKKLNEHNIDDILEKHDYDYDDLYYSDLDFYTLEELYKSGTELTDYELSSIIDEFGYTFEEDYEEDTEL